VDVSETAGSRAKVNGETPNKKESENVSNAELIKFCSLQNKLPVPPPVCLDLEAKGVLPKAMVGK
jgi:hypothetical protein